MRLFLALLLGAGAFAAGACKTSTPSADVKSTAVTIQVEGMTWAVNCPPQVRSALENVEGVEVVEVDYGAKTAVVTCTGDCDREALVAALEASGFEGEVQE